MKKVAVKDKLSSLRTESHGHFLKACDDVTIPTFRAIDPDGSFAAARDSGFSLRLTSRLLVLRLPLVFAPSVCHIPSF